MEKEDSELKGMERLGSEEMILIPKAQKGKNKVRKGESERKVNKDCRMEEKGETKMGKNDRSQNHSRGKKKKCPF